MLNKIFIMGRLTRDPELRRTKYGTPNTSIYPPPAPDNPIFFFV